VVEGNFARYQPAEKKMEVDDDSSKPSIKHNTESYQWPNQ
jgi:hypothetical protein